MSMIEQYSLNTQFKLGNTFCNGDLSCYENLLKRIENISNKSLDIPIDYRRNGIELSVDITKISKELIYKIFNTYLEKKRLHRDKNKINKFLKESKKPCTEEKELFSGWCKDEKEVFPSSKIHREIDNQCKDYNLSLSEKDKKYIFFYIANRLNIKLNIKAIQSTMVQQLIDIPDVIEVIDKLGITHDHRLKYDFYYFLAENIYNLLLKNEKKIDFISIKNAIKEIIQDKIKSTSTSTSFYPKYTFVL
ncbi:MULTISPECIES: hypothetical protein [Enterobacterales]|nr:hypothetical protein [Shigella sp. FC130]ODQ07935.1 hypothetical protein BGK50_13470 [Shigella sp. FC130]